MTLPILTCPLKPVPEESRLVAPMRANLGDAPANACTRDACAWWMKLQNPNGEIVGNCAVPVLAVATIGVDVAARTALGAILPPPPAKPSA